MCETKPDEGCILYGVLVNMEFVDPVKLTHTRLSNFYAV